jgi:hypothetical protein
VFKEDRMSRNDDLPYLLIIFGAIWYLASQPVVRQPVQPQPVSPPPADPNSIPAHVVHNPHPVTPHNAWAMETFHNYPDKELMADIRRGYTIVN